MTDLKKGSGALFRLCWAAYTVSYITRLNFSTAMPAMIAAGLFDKSFGGIIGTGFFACYGLGQLVNGFLGDRVDPKYMIGTGVAASGIMNILMAVLTQRYALAAVWCLNGYFCSMLWAPVIRCFAYYMTEQPRMKAGIGISTTIPAGGILAYLIGSAVLGFSTYRALFIVSGCIGIAMSAVWFFGMGRLRGYLSDVRAAVVAEDATKKSGAGKTDSRGFFTLLVTTGLVFAALCIFFNGVLKDGITLWIPTFLSEYFGVTASQASLVSIVLPIINLGGAYAARWLDRRFFRNEMTTTAFMFGISLAFVLLLYFFGSVSAVFSALLIAICTSAMLGANTMLLTFIPLSFSRIGRSATFTGFFDACSYLASAAASSAIGVISAGYGWNVTILTWCGVAAAGLVISAVGSPFWKKGKAKI